MLIRSPKTYHEFHAWPRRCNKELKKFRFSGFYLLVEEDRQERSQQRKNVKESQILRKRTKQKAMGRESDLVQVGGQRKAGRRHLAGNPMPRRQPRGVPRSQAPGRAQSRCEAGAGGARGPTHCGDHPEVRVFIRKRFGSSIQLVTF